MVRDDLHDFALAMFWCAVLALIAWGGMMMVAGKSSGGALGERWAAEQGLSDQEKQWFRRQVVPDGAAKGGTCCSEADGTYAEEDIRDGHYWTKFTYKKWNYGISGYVDAQSDWMPVPDEVILSENHHGAPVVWWWIPNGQDVKIRCYARGAGI